MAATNKPPQGPDREFANFQQNIKRTALGVNFARMMLKNPDAFDPRSATKILKALGFPISSDVILAQDAIQATITGAAVVGRVNEASDLMNYKDIVKPGISSVSTLTQVLKVAGLMDSQTASEIALAGDVCLLIASGGADLGAWLRVGLSVANESGKTQAEAEIAAKKAVVGAYSADVKKQSQNFVASLNKLQSGDLGVFSFLVETATTSSILFPNMIMKNEAFKVFREKIPGLNLLPLGAWQYKSTGYSTTFWGEEKSANFDIRIPALLPYSGYSVTDFLLANLIMPSARSYLNARNYFLSLGKADIFHVAILSLFQQNFVLNNELDFASMFRRNQLTPFDIGEGGIFKGTRFVSGQSAITFSDLGTQKKSSLLSTADMNFLDESGDAETLLKDPNAVNQVRSKFSSWYNPTIDASAATAFDWRNFANFMSVLDFLDMIYTDPQFSQMKSRYFEDLNVFPKLQEFRARYELCFKKSMIRKTNLLALQNVSYFLGAPVSKIENNLRTGTSSVFVVKG